MMTKVLENIKHLNTRLRKRVECNLPIFVCKH